MAKFWLINQVLLQTGKKLPGDLIDDEVDNVPQIKAAGGVLWPFADSIVADAAAKVSVSRLGKAVNEQELFNQMNAATQNSTQLTGANQSPNLLQDTWYIHPQTGNDNKDGKTANKAIKTWAEWRRRVGEFTTLNPTGGTLRIYILGDMPITDPINFTNTMAPGCVAIITGTKTQVAQGTISAVADKDRTTNTHWKITDSAKAAGFWGTVLGHSVEIVTGAGAGSRAYVARDMNALAVPVPKSAHMSEWVTGTGELLDVQSGNAPQAGDTYKVYNYSTCYFGIIEAHGSVFDAVLPDDSWRGPQFVNLLVENHAVPYGSAAIGPTDPDAVMVFADCMFNLNLQVACSGRNMYFANCSTRGGIKLYEGWVWYLFGCHQPGMETVEEAGGMDMLGKDAVLVLGGDPTFVGKDAGVVDASINTLGICVAGPHSHWDSYHTVLTQHGGHYDNGAGFFAFGDPWTGEVGYVPIWGNGNGTAVFVAPQSQFLIGQFQVGPIASAMILPTVEYVGGVGLSQFEAYANYFTGVLADKEKFHPWDSALSKYTAKMASTFANFDVGGLFVSDVVNDGQLRFTTSFANRPEIGAQIQFNLGVFEP